MEFEEEYYPLMVRGRKDKEAYDIFDHITGLYLKMGLNVGDAKSMATLLFPTFYKDAS